MIRTIHLSSRNRTGLPDFHSIMQCGKCEKTLGRSGYRVQCAGKCALWFHRSCCKIPDDVFKMVNAGKRSWFCDYCELGSTDGVDLDSAEQVDAYSFGEKSRVTNDDLMKMLVNIQKQNAEVLLKMKSLERKNAELRNEVKALKTEQASIQRDIESLKSKEYAKEAACQLSSEDVISEINERAERAKNVILFNLAEPDDASGTDSDLLQNIFSQLPVECKIVKSVRLGKGNTCNVRPIKITLDSPDSVISVLKNRASIRDQSLFIRSDQTVMQREYFKGLKTELDRRKASGELDLKIRYIGGVPRIVKSKKE